MDRRRAFNSIFFPSFISPTFSFNGDLFRLSRFLSQFFFPLFFFLIFFFENVIAAEILFRPQRENKKKTEAAITSSNMKYKIQNHFAHNGVQVFLHQKCAFPYFILLVKQENTNAECEKKSNSNNEHTHSQFTTKFSSSTIDGIAMGGQSMSYSNRMLAVDKKLILMFAFFLCCTRFQVLSLQFCACISMQNGLE